MKPQPAGPKYILRSSFPKASRLLDSLLHNMTRAGYGTDSARSAMWNSMTNMVSWREGEPVVTWLLDANPHSRTALLAHASTLELRGEATAEQIKDLRDAAASFSKWLKDTAEPAPVVAVKPPSNSYPSAMVTRKPPKPTAPVVPLTLSIAFGPDRHEITFPVDLADREDCGHYVTELLDAYCLLRTMAPITERWVVKAEGDVLEAGPNPNALAVQSGINRLLSRLRAIGAISDGVEIDPRDREDYVYGAGAAKIERGQSTERGMAIGSR